MTEVTNATLRLRDPVLFLFGVEGSIRRVQRCPTAIWLGMALVAAAAIAREYDAVSWVHNPGDLLGPFGASLLLCTILFVCVMSCLGLIGRKNESIWRDYRVFLTGYWMTAPLAWLYAVPIETMADELSALRFNLTLLSIVSIWRVLLFARVVAIQFGLPMLGVLPWVLTPCMVIAFIALLSATLSMVSIMGGIRLTQTQEVLVQFQSNVAGGCFYGIIPALVLSIVSIIAMRAKKLGEIELGSLDGAMLRSVWGLPIAATLVLLGGAIMFQPRLYRSTNIDRLLEEDRIVEGIQKMQQYGRDAFPIVWDPPPKYPDLESKTPSIVDLIKAIEQTDCEDWISQRLLVQADEIAMRQVGWYQGTQSVDYLRRHFTDYTPDNAEAALVVLRSLAAISLGDKEVIKHRNEMIEALEEVRERAIVNQIERDISKQLY